MKPHSREKGSAVILGIIFVLILLAAYTWGKYYWSSREEPLVEDCRQNLLTISTALEIYRAAEGGFVVDSLGQLGDYVEEPFGLTCPESGQPYIYYAAPDSYFIACPVGHGEIDVGRVSWRR